MRSADQDLCIDCGMCCDGSLFWAVPIDADDPAPVAREDDGRFRQPCACFDGACTIYARRPAACRAFDCRVLLAVKAGHRDTDWARSQIASMKELLAELEAVLPGDAPSIYRRAAEFIAQHQDRFDDPDFQRENPEVLRLLPAYEQALARFQVAQGS